MEQEIVYFVKFLMFFTYLVHAADSIYLRNLIVPNVTILRNTRFTQNSDTERELTLNSYINVSFEQCLRKCSTRLACKAVEYQVLRKYCSLRSAFSAVDTVPGFITVVGFDETKPCGNTNCESGRACDTQTNTCVVKECGYPAIGRDTRGNRFEVGGRVVYNCLDHLEQLTCTHSADWKSLTQLQYTDGLTCHNIRQWNTRARSGLYRNRLNLTIYCEFDESGPDWMVFQRRLDGSVDFYRNWTEYKTGFGDMCGEFWLGLENIHAILVNSTSQFELRVDLEDWGGKKRYAVYDVFNLNGEEDGYRLQCEGYSGTAGNGLNALHQRSNGKQFTTMDRHNDEYHTNCAVLFHGAWWYDTCHASNLNGYYYIGGHTEDFATGAVWKPWKGHYYSYKTISMKMREKPMLFN